MNRLNTLEHTHSVIMNLPSVLDELNCKSILSTIDTSLGDKHTSQHRESTTIENKLDAMEKKNEALLKILDKVLIDIQSVTQDIKVLKETSLRYDKSECLKTNESPNLLASSTESTIQPSIVLSCKNENIQFDMKEEENYNKDTSLDICYTSIDADI